MRVYFVFLKSQRVSFILVDPYARVIFETQSQVTEILTRTLCPTWDQTLIFENIQLYGSIEQIVEDPPTVIIELFDKDPVVSEVTLHTQNYRPRQLHDDVI